MKFHYKFKIIQIRTYQHNHDMSEFHRVYQVC